MITTHYMYLNSRLHKCKIGMHQLKRTTFGRRKKLTEGAGPHVARVSVASMGRHVTLGLSAMPATGAIAAEHR